MARDLVALRFQVGLHTTDNGTHKSGHAKYPDFNKVSSVTRKGMDWCKYIDAFGIGMQYDKACGHKEESAHSPFGEQCCVVAVPADFADEALALFPTVLTELTVAEFEDFYDNKAHAHETAEHIDTDVLDAITQKEKLGLAVPEKIDAIDVTTETRGIRKNHDKLWADKKVKCGCNVISRKKAVV
jgi:hypothetical protein